MTEDADPDSCLHLSTASYRSPLAKIRVERPENNFVEIIASNFECRFGRLRSNLLHAMGSTESREDSSDSEFYLIDSIHRNNVAALKFIHDGELKFTECSALTFARTATYLLCDGLAKEIVGKTDSLINDEILNLEDPSSIDHNSDQLWDIVFAREYLSQHEYCESPLSAMIVYAQEYPEMLASATLWSVGKDFITNDVWISMMEGLDAKHKALKLIKNIVRPYVGVKIYQLIGGKYVLTRGIEI